MSNDAVSVARYAEENKRLREELSAYKNAEEQGLLIWLPCKIGDEDLNKAADAIKRLRELQTPCDLCRHNPPSSFDGKPCSMCPASAVYRD